LVGLRVQKPIRKETQRRIASLPASGSSFDENMLMTRVGIALPGAARSNTIGCSRA